jgi:hypothetical protein
MSAKSFWRFVSLVWLCSSLLFAGGALAEIPPKIVGFTVGSSMSEAKGVLEKMKATADPKRSDEISSTHPKSETRLYYNGGTLFGEPLHSSSLLFNHNKLCFGRFVFQKSQKALNVYTIAKTALRKAHGPPDIEKERWRASQWNFSNSRGDDAEILLIIMDYKKSGEEAGALCLSFVIESKEMKNEAERYLRSHGLKF